jgi:hypothetical protein
VLRLPIEAVEAVAIVPAGDVAAQGMMIGTQASGSVDDITPPTLLEMPTCSDLSALARGSAELSVL